MRKIVVAVFGVLLLASGCTATKNDASSTPHPSPTDGNVTALSQPGEDVPSPSSIGDIVVSRASSTVIQAQPAEGSCHQRGSGTYALQDARCTPGALNPAVTQATIHSTICVAGYTKSIRPSSSITGSEKRASMSSYGDMNSPSAYEYDHLVSLELGGAANDARNLWPEPGGSPNPKDRLENRLHSLVCSGQLTLAAVQKAIVTNWVAAYRTYVGATPASTQTTAGPAASPAPTQPAGGGTCTASVSNPEPSGGSETVTVHTTPNAAVKTVAHYKTTDSEHDGTSDSSGAANITFSIGRPSHGYTVQVTITTSSGQGCSTSFTPR